MGLELVLLALVIKYKLASKMPYWVAWLAFDVIASSALYAANTLGLYKSFYPLLWANYQPVIAIVLAMACLEQMDVLDEITIGRYALLAVLVMAVSNVELLVTRVEGLVIATVFALCGGIGLLVRGKGHILACYALTQACEHIAVLSHTPKYRSGAIAEVGSVICFTLWIVELWNNRYSKTNLTYKCYRQNETNQPGIGKGKLLEQ